MRCREAVVKGGGWRSVRRPADNRSCPAGMFPRTAHSRQEFVAAVAAECNLDMLRRNSDTMAVGIAEESPKRFVAMLGVLRARAAESA